MSSPYNGYTWKQRDAISAARRKIQASASPSILAYLNSGQPCEICSDPNPPPSGWHSEDYSLPYKWSPPATFIYVLDLSRSPPQAIQSALGMAALFTSPRSRWLRSRVHWIEQHWAAPIMARKSCCWRRSYTAFNSRAAPGQEWWQALSLDPESLEAAWARPRPYRPRPDAAAYRAAIIAAKASDQEMALLKHHAGRPKRCATMRQLAEAALKIDSPGTANLLYGSLAHRIAERLPWSPDVRKMMALQSGCQWWPRAGNRRAVSLNGS